MVARESQAGYTDLARLLGPLDSEAVAQARSGVVITDAQIDPPGPRIVYANATFYETTGYSASEVLGHSPRFLQGPLTERSVLDQLRYCLKHEQAFLGHLWNYRKDGSAFLMEWSVAPLRLGNDLNQSDITHFIAIQRDITTEQQLADEHQALSGRNHELQQALDQLSEIAAKDALTDAYNRRYLFQALERETERSKRSGEPLAVCMFDIDHFKVVNDRHGHQVGDEILRELITRAQDSIRGVDELGPLADDHVLSRYGGEEFLIVLSQTDRAGATSCAERVREAISSQPFTTGAGPVQLSVSLGIAPYDSTQDTIETLIGRADAALFQAKAKGRNRVEAAPVSGPAE